MANTTKFTCQMDSDVKAQSEALYREPRLSKPNKEIVATMMKAEEIAHAPSVKKYADVEEALAELKR